MYNYDQDIRGLLSSLVDKLDSKTREDVEHEIQQLHYFTDLRTQLIDNLYGEFSRLNNTFKSVINDLDDDDE